MAAILPDFQTIAQQTRSLQEKSGYATESYPYKQEIKRQLRIIDEQDAVNRYVWYNLPYGLTSQMIERVTYYRYSPTLFYRHETQRAYCLPYVLNGSIDFLGRALYGRPLPFLGTSEVTKVEKREDKKELSDLSKMYFPDLVLEFAWDPIIEDLTNFDTELRLYENGGVIFYDYTPQYSQKACPRSELVDGLLDMMADIIPFCRTSLENSTGVTGVRITDESAAANIYQANAAIKNGALAGNRFVPVVSGITLQDLAPGATAKSEEFLLTLQALDNYRLSLLGLNNGGLFQKKAHMLEAEQRINDGNSGIILQDGLINRQHAADIFNSIWGTSIYVEISETLTGLDQSGDGFIDNNTGDEAQNNSQDYGGEGIEDV